MSAVLSDCGTYRYALWRDLPQQGVLNDGSPDSTWFTRDETCLFVMLNPSTADAEEDDPTIEQCMRFARSWGFGKIAVANLFAVRSPKPEHIATVADPVGPENDKWICDLANESSMTVVAWGASRHADPARVAEVVYMLDHDTPLMCLGTTQAGHPRHPLYLPKGTELVTYTGPAL